MRIGLAPGEGAVVAARTLPRRTLEAGVDVTGSAINPDVAAGEREARRKMIKRCTGPSLGIARFAAEQRCNQCDTRTQT